MSTSGNGKRLECLGRCVGRTDLNTTDKTAVLASDPDGDRWEGLLADYNELRGALDELTAEGKRDFPRGFTGNGVPGDFESLEADFADADGDLRDWLASEDGQTFKRLRAIMTAAASDSTERDVP